ncbi:MAG: protein-ADP-ribose hydrolase, partial [Bacillota bacterium]|nr:protein-ADP-ribose hydrolase [Bacillota bacterium]
EIKVRGIVDAEKLPAVSDKPEGKGIVLWQGDITTLKADAIVNAANSRMEGCFIPCHGCIDNIIHSYSGIQLRLKCHELMIQQGHEEPTGKAKITPAYNLPSDYVIHTVGPIVSGALTELHCIQLADCYRSCLELANEQQLRSIAFCCISTGEFRFPQEKAAKIAIQTVKSFFAEWDAAETCSIEKVIFNVFKDEDYEIYKKLSG